MEDKSHNFTTVVLGITALIFAVFEFPLFLRAILFGLGVTALVSLLWIYLEQRQG